MKKLIALFTVLSFTLAAIGQNDTTRYTMVNGYGFTYNRLKAKAALVMPADTVQNKLPGSLVVLNDSLYVRTGVKWEKIGANATVDTVTISTRAWRQKGDDSVSALVALRVRISDTASMLLPYLRKGDTATMLAPYFRKGDTITLSNRINLKLNISDTAAMLSPYAKAVAGLPIGGTTGQILAKNSATNYDVAWIDNYTTDVRELVKAGEAINKGQAVYVSGADGSNVIVSKASNNSEISSSKTLGLLYQNLDLNGQGFVIISGRLSGLNTLGATAGDPVWLGTNGNLLYGVANKPVAPAHMVYIGVVTRVNQNNGEIFVNVQNGFELDELHDVSISALRDKDIIYRDSTTSLWKNASISTVLGYTPANNATTVKYTDTASMLTPYYRKADTVTLSNRINLKVNISDTASMLSPYARTSTVNAALATKVNISDTSSMLTPYLRKVDTTAMLSPYARTSNVNAALALKVNISDTASMLTPYIRAAGYGLIKSGQSLLVDTAAIATRARVQKAVDSLGSGKTNGAGTVNYVSKWTGANTLGNSLLTDNGVELKYTGSDGLNIQGSTSGFMKIYGTADNYLQFADAAGSSGNIRYNHTNNFMSFQANDAERVRINSLGYVGIATQSPLFPFQINTYGGIDGNGNQMIIRNNLYYDNTNNRSQPIVNGYQTQIEMNNNDGSMRFSTSSASNTVGTAASITERMRIWNNGNIGINTTTDAGYRLDVSGTARFTNGFTVPTGNIGYFGASRIYDVSNQLYLATNANPMVFTGSDGGGRNFYFNGNVGVGTANPGAKLDVNGGDLNVNNYAAPNDANYSNLALRAGTDATLGPLYFLTQLRPSATGSNRRVEMFAGDNIGYRNITFPYANVGIGTTNPSNKLDVSGTFRATGNSTLPGWVFKTTNLQEATDSSSSIMFRRTIDNNLNFTISPITYQGLATLRFRNFGGGESNFWLSNGRLSFAGGTTESMTLIGSELFVGHSGSPTDAGDYKIQSSGNVRVAGKIDVTATESIGHNIVRGGTSDIAAQIYSSNAWLLYGAESSAGGSIFTGSTQYAAVVGSGYNRPLQFGTNSTIRMEIDSTGLVGINTISPTERLDVNGRARIRTVDSTASAMNMLYVDATGVVKKAPVPGSSIEYYTDVNTIASGWTFVKDSVRNLNHNFINVIKDVNTNEATATMQIAVYRSTSTFTTGAWQTVATVPASYAPKTLVYYELPGYVGGETFYTSSSVRFTGASEYSGAKVVRIDPSGNVEVRIGTVNGSVASGGTNYVVIPIAVTWTVYNIPL